MTVVEQEIRFHTLSGELIIHRNGNLYEMDFPTYELREIPVTDAMEKAFGVRPIKAVLGLDLVCEDVKDGSFKICKIDERDYFVNLLHYHASLAF